jgi:hypothetical protein
MQVILKDVRASFPELFELHEFKGTKSYRCTYLIEKGSENYTNVMTAIKTVAKEKWPEDFAKKLKLFEPQTNRYPIKDGDDTDYEFQKNHIILTAVRSEKSGRPVVVDRNKSPLTSGDGKVYSGVRCNSTVDFWAQQDKENSGIRCALINWQFFKHADSFGGSVPATDVGLPDLGMDDEDGDSDDIA